MTEQQLEPAREGFHQALSGRVRLMQGSGHLCGEFGRGQDGAQLVHGFPDRVLERDRRRACPGRGTDVQ